MSFIKKTAIDLVYDFIGGSLIAIAIMMFSAPNQIAPGGMSGFATITNVLTGVPIGTISLLLNIPLLLLGYKTLGKKFTFNTLRSVAIMTICMDYVYINLTPYTGDRLLASLFAGAIIGAGVGVVFMRGSTTGGTDIIIKMILRKFPYFSVGRISMGINLIVLSLAVIVYGNIESALYGLIMTVVSGWMLDSIIYGSNVGKYCTIVTRKGDEVSKALISDLKRGVTIMDARGAYSGTTTEVLVCVVRKNEYFKLKNTVKSIDPTSFIIVTEANDIIGQGFGSPIEF